MSERLSGMASWLDAGFPWWPAALAGLVVLALAAICWRQLRLSRALARLQALDDVRAEREQVLSQMQAQMQERMGLEFELLASRVLEAQGQSLSRRSEAGIDAMLRPLRQQLGDFQQRVHQLHDQAVRGQADLGAEIRRVREVGQQMGAEAQALSRALKGDKKLAGNWGEMQLERSLQLAGLERDAHYLTQASLKDAQGQRRAPDFLIRLPDDKHMVIDSKVSLVAYARAVSATDDAERQRALDDHVAAVRAHIEDLSRKDYSGLVPGSPSFVLMFLPLEAAYIEALRHDPALFDDGYRRNVVLVSHTTLMPVLKTVSNLWMVVQGNAQAREISDRAGEIYNQVALVAERLKRLGESLDTVSRHYNGAVTAVAGQQGLYGKVARFNTLSTRANRDLPQVQPSHAEFDSEKLGLIVPDDGAQDASGQGTDASRGPVSPQPRTAPDGA